MSQNIEGTVPVITGANSGLGEVIARLLGAEGARGVLAACRLTRIESRASEVTNLGGQALAIAPEVTYESPLKALVNRAVDAHGEFDRKRTTS